MYVNPFVMGVMVTIVAEIITLFLVCILNNKKK